MTIARRLGLLLPLLYEVAFVGSAQADTSGFVGSSACASCHAAETAAWQASDHAWALKTPDTDSVLGDFNDVSFTAKGITSRFYRKGADYMVDTDGPDGKVATYRVLYTVGVRPLQQYVVETAGGRLQALDLAWDTRTKQWFDLYPDQKTGPHDGMHWTGSYKNWQSRCAECHQTGFDKGYDPATRSYKTTWAELTVGCEACHGPGAEHVKLATAAATSGDLAPLPEMQTALGAGHQQAEFSTCGNCHSRRAAFSQVSAPAGGVFSDHYSLALLTPGLYFADGQQDAEVYILGSFLQSKMAAKGVTCSNCHDPHSGKLVAEGNAVCTQCHSEAVSTEFPSLARKDYDSPDHTHHAAGSPAAQCVTCHMPERTYMQVDARRDHFMRRPDPLQSRAAGSPDVCTGCHKDKSADWAAGQIAEWAPGSDTSWQDRGALIAFTSGDASDAALQALADYVSDAGHPAIVRATALQLLSGSDARQLKDDLATAALQDPDALVRAAAVPLLRQSDPLPRYLRLRPLLSDPVRSVRDAASGELAYFDQPENQDQDLAALKAGIAEYLAARMAFADTPESQMAMAGLNLSMKNWTRAIAAFAEATALDPQLEQPWVMLLRIKVALRDLPGAQATLAQALSALPDSAALWNQSAALAAATGDAETVVTSLKKVVTLQPGQPEAWIQLTGFAAQTGDVATALWAGDSAVQIAPDRADAWLASAIGRYMNGDLSEAKRRALRARALDPGLPLPDAIAALLQD